MSLTIGRLALDDPASWAEPVGESVGMLGAVPVPTGRSGLKVSPELSTWAAGTGGTATDRQRVRRQLRAMLNNLPLRQRGFYIAWSEDSEQDGWYVPGAATLEQDGIDVGQTLHKITGLELALLGRKRTHRRAVVARVADRRLSTTPRDVLRRVYSTDFSTLTALAQAALPSNPTDIIVHGATAAQVLTAAESGYQSASLNRLIGAPDLTVVSFEQVDASRNLGDVVILDRKGTTTMLTTGPQAVWEEVYGPDTPLTAGDVPVLENGLVRVYFDTANTDGFKVDVWTGSAWAEQGKVTVQRYTGTWNDLDTFLDARVIEWTPERAVVRVVLTRAADASSRDEVYVTLQRGWVGPRFEVYPARTSAGAVAGSGLSWSPVTAATASTDESAFAVDATSTAVQAATAGSGGTTFTAAALGAASFTGENWVALNREGAAYDVVLAVLQAGAEKRVDNTTAAYGATRNVVQVRHQSAGYITAHLGFPPHDTHEELDNGDFTAGTGTTLSAADATAIDATAASTTRTTDANPHVTLATWLTGRRGLYRVWARVRTTASTLNVFAKTTATTGATKTTTSTTYVWIDLGEITADGSTLEIHLWATAAATCFLDRLEAVKLTARDATDLRYNGARDAGQLALADSRQDQTVVGR